MLRAPQPHSRSSHWAVVPVTVLVACLLGMLLIHLKIERATTTMRFESESAYLISEMESALQIETEFGDAFFEHFSDSHDRPSGQMLHDHHAGKTEPNPHSEANGHWDDPGAAPAFSHPDVVEASAIFVSAAETLRDRVGAPAEKLVADVIEAHELFISSTVSLDRAAHSAGDPMALFHSETQPLESAVRHELSALRAGTRSRLSAAIEDTDAASNLFRQALPLLMVLGIFAVLQIARAKAAAQRVESLQAIVASKNEFVGAISHEVRTPLTGVIGFAELLRESKSDLRDEEQAELLEAVLEQGREVESIVEDLLVAARTEIGRLHITAAELDLVAEARQVIAAMRIELASLDVDPGVDVVADDIRVRQIFRNLLSNAQRYGSTAPSLSITSTDGFGIARIATGGSAIDPEQREKIFEPFHRAHDLPGLPESIGLGLAVSRTLAQLMDGDLTYSREQSTNVFELRLPSVPASVEAIPTKTTYAAPDSRIA